VHMKTDKRDRVSFGSGHGKARRKLRLPIRGFFVRKRLKEVGR
jgi:hypothetical protein